ncbi:transporter [Lysobacter daejeonensis GH1-9]|uniref:Transporter n=1 Tax=Lysobacter daejeonensis GH1-9 TaxID=1385517 RepID=A0A0A0EQ97_9GAMM|nr:transporter [Lysobacter daejeonensis GH1-9]
MAASTTHTELPPRPRSSTAALVLATLAVGFTLWATQGLVLPILLAMFFALVGNPIIRGLQRLYVPRFIGALAVLCGGIAITVLLGSQLVEPVGDWMREVPREMRSVAPKLQRMIKPVQEANKAAENIARAAGGENTTKPVQVVKTEANDPYKVLMTTPRLAASVLAVVLLTFFFMVYGANLQKKALALLPGRQQQKLTVEILQSIEREISRYVLTITVINFVVGLVFAGALMLLDVPMPEALMWGTMAALLNFAPYVGPLIGIIVMLLMGFVSFDEPLQSLLPAGIYLLLHTLEGQIITPIVLGKRMAISPLMLILALMVSGWLWGIIGLLLAVPLLVCVKLVLERIEGLDGWARLLE